jgi:hypothetical protein
MAIDKRAPRKLNSSKDNRISGKDEFNDALNISITEDYADIGGSGVAATADSGDAGVIRPAEGNEAVGANALFDTPSTTRRCVGSVTDTRTGMVFFFVSSTDVSEIGVYAIDTQGYLGGNASQQMSIFRSPLLNFQSTSHVVGEVVHLYDENAANEQQQFRPYLYFTDNINEPRRLDVVRAAAAETAYDGQPHNIADFITACPKTPLTPITFTWNTDPTRSVSEFRSTNGFTFAYQCLYRSGEESALSTFSQIAVPPIYVEQGSSTTQNLNTDNYITLRIQKALDNANTDDISYNYTDEIDRLRILVRQGDRGAWFVIDEIDAPVDNSDVTYDFYNDRVLTGISVEEANKQFDNLPQLAEALAVVENRLFYGNYVEGYDNGEITANIQVSYINRPQDFVDIDINATPIILPQSTTNFDENLASNTDAFIDNRRAGYMIDTSSISQDIPEGSIINFSLRVSPAKHWHFYDSFDSYHAHNRMGVGGVTSDGSTFSTDFSHAGAYPTIPVMGDNSGVGNLGFGDQISWITEESPTFQGSEIPVKHGTSPANPFVIQGKPIEFTFTAITTQDIDSTNSASVMRDIIGQMVAGQESEFAEIIGNAQITSQYNIDIPLDFAHLTDADLPDAENIQAKHAKLKPNSAADLNIINCITAVFDDSADSLTQLDSANLLSVNPCACGYYLIRNANVQFSLDRDAFIEDAFDDNTKSFLKISLDFLNIQGAYDSDEPGVVTCIPVSGGLSGGLVQTDTGYIKEWRAYKYKDLQTLQTLYYTDEVQWDSPNLTALDFGTVNPNFNLFAASDFTDGFNQINVVNNSNNPRSRWIGGLKYEQGSADQEFRNNLIRTDDDQFANPDNSPIRNFTMIDGEAGLRNARRVPLINTDADTLFFPDGTQLDLTVANLENDILSVAIYDEAQTSIQEGLYSLPQILFGHASSSAGGFGMNPTQGSNNVLYPVLIQTQFEPSNFIDSLQNVYAAITNSPVQSSFANANILNADSNGWLFTNVNEQAAPINVLNSNIFFTEGEQGNISRSFKTSANHGLGIVYYDERGRSGPVAPLPSRNNPSVYVAGYSNEERDGLQGRVEMIVNMNTPPPDWAWYYQFVYAGNSTYDKFIQYTTGGAFTPTTSSSEGKSIYVSLNYLQDNDDVSYAEAWGAVDYTGDKRFYQHVPGDYLRIISYNTNEDNRVFPIEYTFEITGAVTLPDNPEENPIAGGQFVDDGAGVHPARRGSFIILRDNPSAEGFSAADVASATSLTETNAHFWNNRTVVEIVRPKRLTEEEDQVYYEIGSQYRITRVNDELAHQFNNHVITQGDVWWRRVPVNIAEYSEEDGLFLNLIQEENEEELLTNAPRFRDVYLETMTYNDTFAGNNVLGYGKPKLVGPSSQRVRRFSSITFSDVNDYSTNINRFTSFNLYNLPFKDLPNEFGNINYLLNYNDSLFVLQKDKASQVPVSRDIISTATGQDSIVVSNKILGAQIHYAGSYGTDNNPESVIKVDNNVYFAHKNRGEVYKFNPSNGIQIISDKGMATHIRDDFQAVLASGQTPKIVSGYDPVNDEYLITIVGVTQFTVSPTLFDRPSFAVEEFDVDATVPVAPTGGGGPVDEGPDDGPPADVFEGAFDDPLSGFDEEALTKLETVTTPYWGTAYGTQRHVDVHVIPSIQGYSEISWPADVAWNDVVSAPDGLPAGYGGVIDLSSLNASAGNVFHNMTSEYTIGFLIPAGQVTIGILVRGAGEFGLNNGSKGFLVITDGIWNNTLGPTSPYLDSTKQDFTWSALETSSPAPIGSASASLNTPATVGDHLYWHSLVAQGNALGHLNNSRNLEPPVNQALLDLIDEADRMAALVLNYPNSNATLAAFGNDLQGAVTALQGAVSALPFSSNTTPYTNPNTGSEISIVDGYGYDYRFISNNPANQPIPSLVGIQQAVINLQEVAESVNPNTLLDGSAIFASMSATIDTLRNNLDVVTNQLEEMSSSITEVDTSAGPLIPNVQSSNNNFTTLGALAVLGGNTTEVGQDDVQPANIIAEQLEFLSSNGIEITGDLVRQLLENLEQSFREIPNTLVRATDSEEFTVDGLQLARASTMNKADLTLDGVVGSADLLESLGQYGDTTGSPISEAEYIDLTNNIASSYNA